MHAGTKRTKSPHVAWNRHAASLVPYRPQDAAEVMQPQGDQTVTDSVLGLGIRPGVMEFLNEAAFEEEYGSQESWLSPTPGAKKYVPFFDLQTQTQCLQVQTQGLQVVQGSQVIPRSVAALLGGFPLIIPARIPAKPKQNAPLPPSAAGTATPGGHTPFSAY
ncbi:hypothetical protein PCASD_23163 [Puccinia coronata f. sp. avenae]|uniref:Uncharacterized protein n=1 Tax=Puccinia coronata f. sp. avenae TaxID=200324 RepID=A0A2N5SL94_9BASI|nr:hypothetical protein PCASD_23163 [Puccinia coronata f. sp. avenae]